MTSPTCHPSSGPIALFSRTLLAMLALVLLTPATLWAQEDTGGAAEDAKWKVTLVDATAKMDQSKSIRQDFSSLLDSSPRVEVVKVEEFPDSVGFERRKFSVESRLKKKADEIKAQMEKDGIEAILVMDLISKGRRLRLVAIGPNGEVVYNEKANLDKRGRLEDEVAKRMLSEALTPVAPLIEQARAAKAALLAQQAKPKALEETDEFGDPAGAAVTEQQDIDTLKDSDVDLAAGPLGTQTRLSVGPFLGLRTSSTTTSQVFLEQRNPFLGAGGQFSFVKGLAADTFSIGVEANIAWAPFSSELSAGAEGQTLEVGGNYLQGGGVVRLTYALNDLFFLGLRGGAEALSVTLDENATYTGHRYIWGKGGLELGLAPMENFTVWFFGHALPLIQAENSGNAYGEEGSSLGFDVGTQINALVTETVGIDLLYKLTAAETEFATPPQGQTTLPVSEELVHQVLVMAGVRF